MKYVFLLLLATLALAAAAALLVPRGPQVTEQPAVEPAAADEAVLVGAADVGVCDEDEDKQTARLLDGIQGTIFVAGDLAYPEGSEQNFEKCYGPTWGRHKARTRPVPGNHEYEARNAGPYFEYFGDVAGPDGKGYYSYNLGSWHIVALNSNTDVERGSAQEAWLRSDLAANPA